MSKRKETAPLRAKRLTEREIMLLELCQARAAKCVEANERADKAKQFIKDLGLIEMFKVYEASDTAKLKAKLDFCREAVADIVGNIANLATLAKK